MPRSHNFKEKLKGRDIKRPSRRSLARYKYGTGKIVAGKWRHRVLYLQLSLFPWQSWRLPSRGIFRSVHFLLYFFCYILFASWITGAIPLLGSIASAICCASYVFWNIEHGKRGMKYAVYGIRFQSPGRCILSIHEYPCPSPRF